MIHTPCVDARGHTERSTAVSTDEWTLLPYLLLRGGILNRAYGTHKNLHISLFLLTNSWSCLPRPPVIPAFSAAGGAKR